MIADVKGHEVAQVASIGDHLGLFEALLDGPRSSDEVATATGLDEPTSASGWPA